MNILQLKSLITDEIDVNDGMTKEEIDHGNVNKEEMSSYELAAAEQMLEMLDSLKQDLEEILE